MNQNFILNSLNLKENFYVFYFLKSKWLKLLLNLKIKKKAYDKGNLSDLNNSLNATNNNTNNNCSSINMRKISDDSSSSSINEDDEIDEQKKSHDKKLK